MRTFTRLGLLLALWSAWDIMPAPARQDDGPCGASYSEQHCSGSPDWCSFSTTSCQQFCGAFDNWLAGNCTSSVEADCNPNGSLGECADPGGGGCSETDCEEPEDCCEPMGCVFGTCEEPPR
jgi:hypothetical protein